MQRGGIRSIEKCHNCHVCVRRGAYLECVLHAGNYNRETIFCNVANNLAQALNRRIPVKRVQQLAINRRLFQTMINHK